jgi:hypothetical protein
MRFALELYNLPSTWHVDEDAREQVDKLKLFVEKNSQNLSTFTNISEHSTSTYRGNQSESDASRKGGDGGADGQFEDCGYNVVPDILETDGGTWELIDKYNLGNIFSTYDAALTFVL